LDEKRTKPLRQDTSFLEQSLSASAMPQWAGHAQPFLSFSAVEAELNLVLQASPSSQSFSSKRTKRKECSQGMQNAHTSMNHFNILSMSSKISIHSSKSSIRHIFFSSFTQFVQIQIPLAQKKNAGIMATFCFCFLCVTTIITYCHSSESHMHLNTVSSENKLETE